MAFKIVGTVASVKAKGQMSEIQFVGGVSDGVQHKEPCTIAINTSLVSQRDHIVKSVISGISPKGNDLLIMFNSNAVIITKEVMLDITSRLTPKKKGGGKTTPAEEFKKASDALKGKDIFISLNPKPDKVILSNDALTGTHIEVIIHY